MTDTCSSCNKRISNDSGSVKLDCPSCGKTTIIRCSACRKLAAKYSCAECGFTGPN